MSHLPLPQPRPGMPAPLEPRIGNEERDVVVDALSQHYAAGRITHEELEQRSGLALRAQTRSQLAPLLADLPAIRPQRPAGTGLGWVIGAWAVAGISTLVFLALGLLALLVMVAGHAGIGTFVAPLIPLAIALAAGYAALRLGRRRR